MAAVAYVDPGNFATNIAGGAQFGCREHFPRRASLGLWVQAEIIAMATDLAEFVGAAIALNLLFGIPLFPAGLITAVVAFGLLGLQRLGYRHFEVVIAGMLGVILLGFLYDTLRIGFDARGALSGFKPDFAGTDSAVLATAIIGATVMPHVIWLHSALTQNRIPLRDDAERRRMLRFNRIDVSIAMGLAGLVNMSMLIIAASLFNSRGIQIDGIEGAHAQLGILAGGGAALAFALALLASGFASSSVGTFAGQVVMAGFIARTVPLALRRGITMAPALIVLALGLDPTDALVLSQVALSFGIPFAVIPVVVLTRRRDIMGPLVNRAITTAVAAVVAGVIVCLNAFLLFDQFFG